MSTSLKSMMIKIKSEKISKNENKHIRPISKFMAQPLYYLRWMDKSIWKGLSQNKEKLTWNKLNNVVGGVRPGKITKYFPRHP